LAGNYKDYLNSISRMLKRDEEVPGALVEYMYEQSPAQALLVFLRVDRRDETIARLRAIRERLDARREGREARQVEIPQQRDERRELLLATHLVDDAIWFKENKFNEQFQQAKPEVNELLAKLSAHEQWWVRLYVVAIMRREPALRQAGVLEQLRGDGNALVNKAANSLK
jgi:hypothetical protein